MGLIDALTGATQGAAAMQGGYNAGQLQANQIGFQRQQQQNETAGKLLELMLTKQRNDAYDRSVDALSYLHTVQGDEKPREVDAKQVGADASAQRAATSESRSQQNATRNGQKQNPDGTYSIDQSQNDVAGTRPYEDISGRIRANRPPATGQPRIPTTPQLVQLGQDMSDPDGPFQGNVEAAAKDVREHPEKYPPGFTETYVRAGAARSHAQARGAGASAAGRAVGTFGATGFGQTAADSANAVVQRTRMPQRTPAAGDAPDASGMRDQTPTVGEIAAQRATIQYKAKQLRDKAIQNGVDPTTAEAAYQRALAKLPQFPQGSR